MNETLLVDTILDFEENKNSKKERNYTRWSFKGTNKFFPSDNVKIVESVESGVYEIKLDKDSGFYLLKKDLFLDDLFPLPGNVHEKILGDVQNFWKNKDNFKKYGFAYKRGILLHGPPGNGKSSIINLLSKELINNNGIAITIKNEDDLDNFNAFMPEYFRVIEPDRQIICIIEDIDGLIKDDWTETLLLNMLDGLGQMENTIYLATTNYPEELKERVLNRPSRFDRRYEIPLPDEYCRKFYFEKKLKEEDLQNIDLNLWIKETKGFSISHLSDLVKSVFCLGLDFRESILVLKNMDEKLASYNYNKESKTIGFGK